MDSNKQKNGWGGKREHSGRNRGKGATTTAMSLKLDNDLYEVLKSNGLNKNRYINDAVRTKMEADKYIKKRIM